MKKRKERQQVDARSRYRGAEGVGYAKWAPKIKDFMIMITPCNKCFPNHSAASPEAHHLLVDLLTSSNHRVLSVEIKAHQTLICQPFIRSQGVHVIIDPTSNPLPILRISSSFHFSLPVRLPISLTFEVEHLVPIERKVPWS